jgi:PAS domain S-box-containing protein
MKIASEKGCSGETPSPSAPCRPDRQITDILLENLPCAVALVDLDMRYLAVSEGWTRDFQLTKAELIGRSHYEVFPEVPERWKTLHRRALAGETLSDNDDSFIRSDGRQEWVDWQLHPWRTSDGEIGGILIISQVTTWRHQAVETLRDSEARFRATFEDARIGMAIVSLEGRWLRVNRALGEMLGYSTDELLARDFQSITHPDDLPKEMDVVQQFLSADPPPEFRYDKRYLHKDGHVVWATVSGSAAMGTDGQPGYFIAQIQDLTAKKRAESAIIESELRIRAITDNVPVTIGLFDLNDIIRFANADFRRIGMNALAPEGQTAADYLPPSLDVIAAPYRARARSGETVHFIAKPIIDGQERVREVTYTPARDATGTIVGVYGIAYDITEFTRQTNTLYRSESKLSAVVAAMSEALVVQARDGRIINSNRAAEELLGMSRETLLTKSSLDPSWAAELEDGTPLPGADHPPMQALRSREAVRDKVVRIRIGSGEHRWISINSQPLPDTDPPREAAVITTMVDITTQRNAFEQIRALAQRLENARELERRELSKRLHDGVAQNLFAMSLTLQVLNKESKGRVGVLAAYQELKEGLDRCMSELRQVANDLRPAALSHLGIRAALKEHADYFARLSGLTIELQGGADFPELGDSERLLLFRTAQEALTNIAKHAQALRVVISLNATDRMITLTIADDGIGIESSALSKPTSLGLLGLGERFRSLGGSFWIGKNERPNSRGTVLEASLPLPAAPALLTCPVAERVQRLN